MILENGSSMKTAHRMRRRRQTLRNKFLQRPVFGRRSGAGAGRYLKAQKKGKTERRNPLAELLYDADKLSRACYACELELCGWSEEKKNHNIVW